MSAFPATSDLFGTPDGKQQFRRISGHDLIRPIGGGSYGQVWLARSVTGTYRAIKIVLRSDFKSDTPYDREYKGILKFEPISRDHEGFTDILHVGRNDDSGYFYYVMEVGDDVDTGAEIDPDNYTANTLDFQRRLLRRVPFERTLQLSLKLSSALGALHKSGLVHRDIKPSNIIFVNGAPKLADIGLVTDMGLDVSFVGTEGYIPPEGPGAPGGDIFSLGKSLYEVCTGNDRMEFPNLPEDLLRDPVIGERFSEFNEVLVKACENNPAKRYQSADEVHAHLALLQAGKSVRRIIETERLLQRIKTYAPIAAVLLVGAFIFFFLSFREKERQFAEHQRQIASAVNYGSRAVENGDALGALPWFVEALRLEQGDPYEELTHRIRIGSILQRSALPTQMWYFPHRKHTINFAQIGPDDAHILMAGESGRFGIYNIQSGQLVSDEFGSGYGQDRATFSPDYRFAVSSGSSGKRLVIWDFLKRTNLSVIKLTHQPTFAWFNPAGNRILSAFEEYSAKVWEVESGQELFTLPHTNGVYHASYSHDGRLIGTAGRDNMVGIWSAEDGKQIRQLANGKHSAPDWVTFSPDDRLIASAGNRQHRKVTIWKVNDGTRQMELAPHDDGISSVEFSPDGKRLVTASWDTTAQIWNAESGARIGPPIRHSGKVMYAGFTPDSKQIFTVCYDGFVTFWNLPPDQILPVEAPGSFAPNGLRYFVTNDTSISVHAAISHERLASIPNEGQAVRDPLCDNEGTIFVTFTESLADGVTNTEVRSFHTSLPTRVRFHTSAPCSNAVLSANGALLALVNPMWIELWDVARGRLLKSPKGTSSRAGVAFDSMGQALAVAQKDYIEVFDPWTLKRISGRRLKTPLSLPVEIMEFSPDGKRLIAAFSNSGFDRGGAQVWDIQTGQALGPILKHRDGVLAARFSPDGNYIVTASEDYDAVIWDAKTYTALPIPPLHHGDQAKRAVFSADARWIATATAKGFRLWERDSGEPLTLLIGLSQPIDHIQFAEGGRSILASSLEGGRWLYRLPQETRSLEEVQAVAQLLSGRPTSKTGATAEEVEELVWAGWQRLTAASKKTEAVSKLPL